MLHRGELVGLVLAIALAAAPAVGPIATATNSIVFESVSFTEPGDTVVFELTADGSFETLEKTFLNVTGHFDDTEERQRLAVLGGVVEDATDDDCPDAPCGVAMRAVTIEDVSVGHEPDDNGDARADTGPGLDLAYETGHDHRYFVETTAVLDLQHLEFPDRKTTYHVFVSVPDAKEIDVDLHFVADGDVNVTGEAVHDDGFTHWLDDMRAAGAHTAAGNAYTGYDLLCGHNCGEVRITPGGDERVYGAIGPSEDGYYKFHLHPTGGYCDDCFGRLPFAFAGSWGLQTSDLIHTRTGVGVGIGDPSSEVAIAGWDSWVDFEVNYFLGAGFQDLVAAGFLTPDDPVAAS